MIDLYQLIVMVGAYQVAWWVYRWLGLLYRTFFGTKATTERYGAGSWAVVTGSTDPLGKEVAKQLAREGFNIVLVGKELSDLNAIAKDI